MSEKQMSAREALEAVFKACDDAQSVTIDPGGNVVYIVSASRLEALRFRALPALREAVERDERAQAPIVMPKLTPALHEQIKADAAKPCPAYVFTDDEIDPCATLRAEVARLRERLEEAEEEARGLRFDRSTARREHREAVRLLEGAERSVEGWKREVSDSDSRRGKLRRAALSATRLWPKHPSDGFPTDDELCDALYELARPPLRTLKARADALAEAAQAFVDAVEIRDTGHSVAEFEISVQACAFHTRGTLRECLRAYREEGGPDE